MDSVPFSQSGLLGTQGGDPCFVVMNSQLEESQDAALPPAAKLTDAVLTGPNKQRMLWELASLRGTQPSPVLDSKLPRNEPIGARSMTGAQPTKPQQGSSAAPRQGGGNRGDAAGSGGTGGSNQDDLGRGAGQGAAGGDAGGGNGGKEGGGGDGREEEEEEEEDEDDHDHEETGEETSQDTSSNHSSVPKLVPPPALRTPPRTVRVTEVIGSTVGSPTTSPVTGPEQSDDDQGVGSERGGGVSDAPTAVVGDSTDEGQGVVTSPSPPSERSRDADGKAGGAGLMDPPSHSMIPRKRSSDTSHSSISSSSSHSTNSSSYHASHDTTSSSLLSSLSTSSSSSYGGQAPSSGFTQVKEHPSKPSVPIARARTPSHVIESFRGEVSGEGDLDNPQSSQQDLFSDAVEEKRADRVRVLANETSTSEDASLAEIPPTPDAYRYGFQDTPPHKLDQTLRDQQGPSRMYRQDEQILVNETSTSDDASVTIIQPSPQAWGTVVANTPPHRIEQYSRSSRSAREGSDGTPSTPSETLGSLHLSGQQELTVSQYSGPSIVPPTQGAYGSIPQLIPSTPTQPDEEEPMELGTQEDEDDVAVVTHPAKGPKSTGAYDEEYGIPEWQQVLNKEQQVTLSRSSSTGSKTMTSSSSDQSSESFGRISAQLGGQQVESFQAWQPSSQQTTSTTSEEPSRSRPPSTQTRPEAGGRRSSRKRQDGDSVAEDSRSPAGAILEDPTSASKLQRKKVDKPAAHRPGTPPSHQDAPARFTRLKTTPGDETGRRGPAAPPSSLPPPGGDPGGRVPEGVVVDWEGGTQAGRGGSSDDWMLHYTATQTDTEAGAFEAGTGRRSPYVVERPPVPTSAPPTLSRSSASRPPDGEASAASSTTRGGAAAQSPMSHIYDAAAASSTTASSDAKKEEDDDGKKSQGDKRDVGIEAPPTTRSQDAQSGTVAQSRTAAQVRADPQHSVSLVVPGIEAQIGDSAEFSSIDFHLSLPTEGGLRPAGGVALPPSAARPKERSSSRRPIRHSTPIMDESPDRPGQEAVATSTTAQVDAPKLVRSGTLTLGADRESEAQDGTETPVFQLERPSDTAQLLKAAHESPSKRSTSVFSKVHETKMAAGHTKAKGQASKIGRVKYSDSDDPFALSQDRPSTSSTRPQEPVLTEEQKQAEVEDEDEGTIPVYYQEEERGDTKSKELEKQKGRETVTAKPGGPSEKGYKKAVERTPEKRRQEISEMPALTSRLTRSGQKRKRQEERSQDRKGGRGGAAKKKRREEAEQRTLTKKSPGPRDPYDFSDSQSNKTPSPMKDSRAAGVKPSSPRTPRASAPQLRGHPTKGAAASPPATRSAMTPGSTTRGTPRQQKRDKGKEAPTAGPDKTPPIEEILEASGLARTPPKRGSLPGSKSGSTVKTSGTQGRRPGAGRQRLASQQVLQAQQDDSSPDFQPEQPREKKGVKFRRSPRKKQSQKQEKPAAGDPPFPRRHIVRQTTEYRLIQEKIIVDGKVVKTSETREQVGPIVETVEDEDSVDLPSPSRSISSLTSGSLADVSSMYSKTSSSTPSLVRTLSGGTLSKHSSFSSISRAGSSLGKQTVSSPGSDKSTPSLNKSLSSPGTDRSPGNERRTAGDLMSPGAGGSSIQRRVSFTRGTSKLPSLPRTSSGSGDEIHYQPDQDPHAVFQKPYQTPRRKVDHQQGDSFAQRLSLQDIGEVKSPEEVVTPERRIPASEVAELVQLSQESVPLLETDGEGRSPRRSSEMKSRRQTSRRQTKDKTSVSSSSPQPQSSPSGRRSLRASSVQSEQGASDQRVIPRTRSTPARVTAPVIRSPSASSGEELPRSTRRSEGTAQASPSASSAVGKLFPGVSKKTPAELPVPEDSPRSRSRSKHETRQTRREALASVPRQENVKQAAGEKLDVHDDPGVSTEPERRSPRSSQGPARRTTKTGTPSPTSQRRPSTPPQQSTRPLTSGPAHSFHRDTLLEPPAGETLPIAEGEVGLLPGLKVYTKWLDGFWYPGTIHRQDKLLRYVIEFDDGDQRTVHERDIIIKEWLNRGQSVMAKDADCYYYAGTVVGYYKDPASNNSGYVIEQTISHETSRYERRNVILTKDQAASLVSSASSSSSTSGNNLISLDNIVYSKRTRLRSRLLESPGSGGLEKSPRQPQNTTPSRPGVKRKLAVSSLEEQQQQQKLETPSPRKRGRALAQAVVISSPDPDTVPRRSPRKQQQQQQQQQQPLQADESHPMAVHMGPLPKHAALFRSHAFLVTHGEVKKIPPKDRTSSSSSDSTDESSGEGPDEIETVPFDRSYAVRQIERGGGLVLSDFNKSQIIKLKVLLIANTHCRTKKYFQALAASIPCISHLWLRDCCKSGKLQDHKSYLLPAGESLEENTLMEIQPNRSILAGMNVCMVSDLAGVQDTWRSILIAASCHIVTRLPSNLEMAKDSSLPMDCNLIVTDPSCPRSLIHRAQRLGIPVVSCEWVIQCLINGVRVPYHGHEKYAWNYRDKPTK